MSEQTIDQTPLIWTSKGNLPVTDLQYSTYWADAPEYTAFTEQYRLGEEIVKSSTHVYSKKPLEFLNTEQGAFG